MKYALSFLLLLSFGPRALAEVCNEPPMPGNKELYESVDDLLNHLDGPDLSKLRVEKCGGDEALVRESAKIAGQMADSLFRQAKNYQSNNPDVMTNLRGAQNKLECVQRKLGNGVITCKDLGGDLGWAIPMLGTGISVDPSAIRDINKSYSWTNISLNVHVASVILHEMTHKCGTNDKDYFDLPEDPMTSAGNKWANTADTYQNWALWGFCIPGAECAARKAGRKGTPLAVMR